MIDPRLVAIEPSVRDIDAEAVRLGGGQLSDLGPEVGALIWTDYKHPEVLTRLLDENPQLKCVQLPWAGIDAFANLIKRPLLFTCAKGSYREPVAEHALMLALASARILPTRIRAKSWGPKHAVSLYDSNVVIVGGGGIAEELVAQLKPFRARISIVRNRVLPFAGNVNVLSLKDLDSVLPQADFVFLACALTDETRGLFDAERLSKMPASCYLINVARGPVVDTMALVAALNSGALAGAGIDVTDPEPLPEGHPAWDCENLIITPHSADTDLQVEPMFARRIRENVHAYVSGLPMVGVVDPVLGY
ncbi:MAG: hypothetical protein RJA35_770 [Actinomycetota bacterium]|jgi:phosphoglycerate dehydrogenase-like enzyme